MVSDLQSIVERVRACTVCERSYPPLPHEARPILIGQETSKIRIISQAPGLRAHTSGRPFDDPSGIRLREWLNVDEPTFYNPANFAITPMGFCFPGYDRSGGDLPPRPECAPLWHKQLSEPLQDAQLTLLVGMYAQKVYLGSRRRRTLTETVKAWQTYDPDILPLPHPSWRNSGWLKRHLWFADVISHLQERVRTLLSD